MLRGLRRKWLGVVLELRWRWRLARLRRGLLRVRRPGHDGVPDVLRRGRGALSGVAARGRPMTAAAPALLPDVLTAQHIADREHIPLSTAYELMHRMIHYYVGRQLRVTRHAYETWLRRQ